MAAQRNAKWESGDTCKYEGCNYTIRKNVDPKESGERLGEGLIGMCSTHHRRYRKENNLDGVRIVIDWSRIHFCVTCSKEICKRTEKNRKEDVVPIGRALGEGYQCRNCHETSLRHEAGKNKPMNLAVKSEDGLSQKCNKCQNWFTYESDSFRFVYGKPRSTCRNCDKEVQKIWHVDNRFEIADRRIRIKYNIEYTELLELQDDSCAICKTHVDDNRRDRLDVDHDHSCCSGDSSCGKCVRGLLCGPCNLTLGLYRDDLIFIRKNFGGSLWGDNAVEYLESGGILCMSQNPLPKEPNNV